MLRESRFRRSRRKDGAPIARVGTLVVSLALGAGCGSNNGAGPPVVGGDASTAGDGSVAADGSMPVDGAAPEAGPTSDGGPVACSDNGANIGTVRAIVTGSDSTFSAPLDSVPDSAGAMVYFTALAPDGTGGIFSVPSSGSMTVTPLATGLGVPSSIVVSTDGATLFVADPGSPLSSSDSGGIVTVGTSGGMPSILAGTDGYAPSGLTVNAGTITFTGTDPANGDAGVFSVPVGGGSVTVIAEGDPFRQPSGVAVAASGTVYVLDASSTDTGGSLFAVTGGAASPLVANVAVGYPAGLALSSDETALLVSALVIPADTGQVLRVPLGSDAGAPMSITVGPVATSTEPAGVHRAANGCAFAWADTAAGGLGTVYSLEK